MAKQRCQALDYNTGKRCRKTTNLKECDAHGDGQLYNNRLWVKVWLCEKHRKEYNKT